jgi:hypothetical protein
MHSQRRYQYDNRIGLLGLALGVAILAIGFLTHHGEQAIGIAMAVLFLLDRGRLPARRRVESRSHSQFGGMPPPPSARKPRRCWTAWRCMRRITTLCTITSQVNGCGGRRRHSAVWGMARHRFWQISGNWRGGDGVLSNSEQSTEDVRVPAPGTAGLSARLALCALDPANLSGNPNRTYGVK